MEYQLIVIGTSAGGLEALKFLLTNFKNPNRLPILVLQHISPKGGSYLPQIIEGASKTKTYEVEDKMEIQDGCIYTPAPNYHMLMEKDWTLSLTVEERVSYARPSIDVLFESASDACKDKLIGIILTGANHDGAYGLSVVAKNHGYTIVQDPKGAYAKEMPSSTLKQVKADFVGSLEDIKNHLERLISS